MADPQGSPLFQDCTFAFVVNRDLPLSTAEDLQKTLEDHSGQVEALTTDGTIDLENVTHIISATSDFPQYADARLHMVPVITPSWITQSLLKDKLAQMRAFTPDPNLFFANVTVSCADIPNGDKDAIIGAVLALGGMETSALTKMTTHICALTLDHPKCQSALEKHLKCKIVLPHWFDDCLKLGKRIDERPYLLPDPEIFRMKPEENLPMPSTEQLRGAESPHPEKLDLATTGGSPRRLEVFRHKKVMVSSDLEIGTRLRGILEDLVENSGGHITSSIYKANMFVCRWREGRDYVYASCAGVDVGNLSWLYHLITYDEWTSPLRRLLHYPLPKNGIPGFKGTRITLSNYGGEARTYLENLVYAAGGEFTKSMKQDNTHLITARNNSEKCSAAAEWNISMINHLWLEESYAKCEMQRLTDPRYIHFPPRTNLGEIIGETQFDANILEELYFPKDPTPSPNTPRPTRRQVMHEKDHNSIESRKSTSEGPVNGQDEAEKIASIPRPKKTHQIEARTPASNRRISGGKENDTPSSTGSRSAKEKAMSRLHGLAPDIALYEKEKKRKGAVWGGERAANNMEKERLSERSSSPAAKREAEDELSEEEESRNAKRLRQHFPPIEMRLLVTGYQGWIQNPAREDPDKKKLRELGVLVTQEANNCTHLAAPTIVRTQKFLCALVNGPVIVSSDFMDTCIKTGNIPPVQKYILKDHESEKKYGIKLKDVVTRARANKRNLLRHVPIYFTEYISQVNTYRAIIEANGGTFAFYKGKPTIKKVSAEEDTGPAEPIYLLTGQRPEEKRLWPKFIEMAEAGNMIPRIVDTEWLLDVAMSQQQKWNKRYDVMTQ